MHQQCHSKPVFCVFQNQTPFQSGGWWGNTKIPNAQEKCGGRQNKWSNRVWCRLQALPAGQLVLNMQSVVSEERKVILQSFVCLFGSLGERGVN